MVVISKQRYSVLKLPNFQLLNQILKLDFISETLSICLDCHFGSVILRWLFQNDHVIRMCDNGRLSIFFGDLYVVNANDCRNK